MAIDVTLEFEGATARRLRFRFPNPSHANGHDRFESDAIEAEPDGILPSPPRIARTPDLWENAPQRTAEQEQEVRRTVSPLVRLPRERAPQRRFDILQQWEGVVTEIGHDAFWAEIRDLTNPSSPSEVDEIPLAEIPPADLPLLAPGSVFYWIIGYETSLGGQIRRVSEIRVRRTPEWSQRAIDSIKARAHQLFEQLNGNGENRSTSGQ